MNTKSLRFPWHVIVAIPAQNEDALIERCLISVIDACQYLPANITYDIVLCDDGSTDQTYAIAKKLIQSHGQVISTLVNNVGLARRLAVTQGLKKYSRPLKHCWIGNTDADSVVPPDWLYCQLQLAERNVAAIAGIIDIDTFEEHDEGVPQLFRDTYLLNADGTHSHVHGANLGIRADTYLDVGGWSGCVTAEDHDLWRRLKNKAVSSVSSTAIKVITSGRRIGRAPNGFAETLAKHNQKKFQNA